MNEFEIILNGGYKGCCNIFPASQLRMFLKDWYSPKDKVTITIIDIERDYWESDELADYAFRKIGNECFPLVYLNNSLIAVSQFPDKSDLDEWLVKSPVITKESILLSGKNNEK